MPGEWKPDPLSKHELRYHDGNRWTEHVSNQGTASIDPIDGPRQAEAATVSTPVARPSSPDPRAPYGAGAAWQPADRAKVGISRGKVLALVLASSLVANAADAVSWPKRPG